MADRLPFGEGASINRPPLFCGLNYQFWKVRMKIFVESLDKGIWDAMKMAPLFQNLKKMDLPLKNLDLSRLILKARRPNLIALLKT